jgi:hypothetical protein
VNGLTVISNVDDPLTHEKKQVEDPSFVVRIPRAKSSLLSAQPRAPELIAPPAPQQSTQGGGKLKSVGD